MKACEKCGTIVGEDARFCGSCSSEALILLPVDSSVTVASGKQTCPRCEVEVDPGAKYCKNCQLPFEKGAAFGRMSILGGGGMSEETSVKKTFVIAVAVVVAATIVVVLTIVWMGWSENSPRGVIKQALDNIESADSDALIKIQSRKTRESILAEGDEPNGYAERVAEASRELKRMGGVKSIDIVEETSNNERASVVYTINYGNGEKKTSRAKLVLENGKWKLTYWPVVTPATVAREALTAMGRGDGEAIRKLLSNDLLTYQISLYGKQGARENLISKYIMVGDVFESNGGITSIEIKKEQETDEEATVDYILTLGNGQTRERQMWLVKEKGLWKISMIPDHSLTNAPPVFSSPY